MLSRTDPADLGPKGKEIHESVQQILAMESKLAAMCKEAKSDGVVTPAAAQSILEVCQAYLLVNPRNEEGQRLEALCRQIMAKAPPAPMRAPATSAAPAGGRALLPTTTAAKIAWCRAHDSKGRSDHTRRTVARGATQRPTIRDRVITIVAKQLGVSEEHISPDKLFIDDLGADSLDLVEITMALEEEFEINIPDEQAEKIR